MAITDLAFIDPAGFHLEDFPSFLNYYTTLYQGIYGADTYLGSDSQDGQFITACAQAAFDTASLAESVYNSFSPLTAQGAGLARLVKINGLTKLIATNSTVNVTIVGQAGTVISNGVVQDTLQQLWNLPTTVSIPSGGSVIVTATAQLQGDLSAAVGSVTKIFTPTLGWQSVTNATAAVEGAPIETDGQLRLRQSGSTANPSLTVLEGMVGAVENIAGVTAAIGYENDTESTDGNGIPSHETCIVANGGDAMAIANAILVHKTPGIGTFGNTSQLIYDSHGMPVTINFQTAIAAVISVAITITVKEGWTDDYIPLIKAAVAAVINAGTIGQTVTYAKLFVPAYLTGTAASTTFDVEVLQTKKNAGSFGTTNITLNFDELASCNPSTNVTVTKTT